VAEHRSALRWFLDIDAEIEAAWRRNEVELRGVGLMAGPS
jgi:hypothetical protein